LSFDLRFDIQTEQSEIIYFSFLWMDWSS